MLYDKLNSEMKSAMISKDKDTLSTLRYLKSAIDLYRINNKLESVTDEVVIDLKKREMLDSIFNNNYLSPKKDFMKLINDFALKDDEELKEYISQLDKKALNIEKQLK